MSESAFFAEESKQRAVEATVRIEARSSAEIVVALRKASGSYRHSDYLFGMLVSVVTLVALLFLPQSFDIRFFPIDVTIAFVIGSAFCARIPTLQRWLSSRRLMEEHVRNAVRAAFFDLGVSGTTRRSGVLVYVSLLERRAEVLCDIGIDPEQLGKEWENAVEAVQEAVKGQPDHERFFNALESFGAILGRAYPRAEDDVNELPDGVQ